MAASPPKYTPCYFLLPLTYNDGTRVEKEMREKIEDLIFVEFGGWRITDTRRGGYLRQDTGLKQVEITQRIRVDVLGEAGIAKLKKIVQKIGVWLDQESMHFEVAVGSEVEFLPTSEKEGHSDE
jgi:hypothetical protein